MVAYDKTMVAYDVTIAIYLWYLRWEIKIGVPKSFTGKQVGLNTRLHASNTRLHASTT